MAARRSAHSLADTEAAKNHTKQIVRRERAGDRIQLILREPQFFGEQIECLRVLRGMVGCQLQMVLGCAQRDQMAFAGQIHALRARLPTSDAQQLRAQQFDAAAMLGR